MVLGHIGVRLSCPENETKRNRAGNEIFKLKNKNKQLK
jgi:hypothetical protein